MQASGLALLGTAGAALGRAEDKRAPPSKKTIAGDPIEPKWGEMLTVTVGPKDADLVGSSEKVLQAAVDYVTRLGGGTIRILPGTYHLRNAVYLQSRIRIVGSGAESVLVKEPSSATKLAADSDWYDQEITLADAKGFQLGDGVCLRAKNPHNGGQTVIKRTLVARSGNRFKLDKALRENLWLQGQPTAATLFPIFSGEFIADVVLEDLKLDGNRSHNDNLDGNYAGCVFLQDCQRVTMRNLEACNYNGDGLSWQICHDVLVEGCQSYGHAGLGLHPGSGSQRPIMRNNKMRGNDIGIFFCWGVTNGLAEKNVIEECRTGVSIGHRDTDNVVRDNDILKSGLVGVLFRNERKSFGAHRNRIENNRVIDSGPDAGVAIDVQGETESVTLAKNKLRETRQPMARIGVRVGAQASDLRMAENQIEGFARSIVDLRKT
jgi:hypothetical protein